MPLANFELIFNLTKPRRSRRFLEKRFESSTDFHTLVTLQIFVSYARFDQELVFPLVEKLSENGL